MHFTAFIDDLKSSNEHNDLHFAKMTRLLQHLYDNAHTPKVETASKLIKMVPEDIPADYTDAIYRLVNVWGREVKMYRFDGNKVDMKKYVRPVTMNRLVFRGDSRLPSDLFKDGFEKRHLNESVTYRGGSVQFMDLRNVSEERKLVHQALLGKMHLSPKAGDLVPTSGVCVSPDLFVSAIFPLPNKPEKMDTTWIYLCKVERGYDTNGRQVMDMLRGVKRLIDARKSDDLNSKGFKLLEQLGYNEAKVEDHRASRIMGMVYGRELATDAIPAKKILGAVRIKRKWKDLVFTKKRGKHADFMGGGSFTVEEILINKGSEIASSMPEARAIGGFFAKMTEAQKARTSFTIPTPDQGYKKAKPTTASDIAAEDLVAIK